MTLQRAVQVISLALFLGLLVNAGFGFAGWLPHDLFLRLDPAAALVTGVAARLWQGAFYGALAVLAVTFFLGRFFCGYLCPLGTTIDGVDACLPQPGTAEPAVKWRRWKYVVLVFILAAALMGLSLAFVTAPIPLVTRFYALMVLSSLQQAADLLLALAAPLAEALDLTGLRYLQLPLPRFQHQWLTLVLVLLILAGGIWWPRFWCRCLCPAGALMALCARRPLFRRQVSDACIACGLCARRCPTGAIGKNPCKTAHQECLVCQTCRRACPAQAITFEKGSAERVPFRPSTISPPTMLKTAGCPPAFQTESGQMNRLPQSGRPQAAPRREADQSVRLSGFQPHCPAPSIGDADGKSVSACLSSSMFQRDAFM